MQRRLDEIKGTNLDVVVIGGGITGAWIALDCVLRGLTVALLEKNDFGSGTSAKSSKLLHGGIRYLQQLRIDKVRESARERHYYHHVAPHLSHSIPFVVPTYRAFFKSRFVLRVGMAAYKFLSLGHGTFANYFPRQTHKKTAASYYLSRDQLLAHIPIEDSDVTGAMVFPESHMESSERMTLAIINLAARRGALCANYTSVRSFIKNNDDGVEGVEVEDRETGDVFDIRARVTVNAAGPWIPDLNRTLFGDRNGVQTTGFSQGSHIVTRQLIADYAIAIPTQYAGENIIDRGGRHIFILPWRGCSLIGTSYAPAGENLDDPMITQLELEQLVGEIKRQMPQLGLKHEDIRHSFTGIYPLRTANLQEQVYQGTGEYQIIDHSRTGLPGLISALGAKYTTARLVAQKTTDIVNRRLTNEAGVCQTDQTRIGDGLMADLGQYIEEKIATYSTLWSEQEVCRLIVQYGPEIEHIANEVRAQPELGERVSSDRNNLKAEVTHAVKSEMALHLDDVLYRRTGMGTIGYPSDECVQYCLSTMANLLNWNGEDRDRELKRVAKYRFSLDEL